MSRFFFCPSCGHNLDYISNRRLKCYGCGKYFTENFVCRCGRDHGFKFSAEIIASNKTKCFFCDREAHVPASLEPPFTDKYIKDRADRVSSWDGEVKVFQPAIQKQSRTQKSKQSARKVEKPGDDWIDYVSENQIIIKFPGHNSLDQIRCENIDGVLVVQSLLVDFLKKFKLPNYPIEIKTDFRNGILDIQMTRQ